MFKETINKSKEIINDLYEYLSEIVNNIYKENDIIYTHYFNKTLIIKCTEYENDNNVEYSIYIRADKTEKNEYKTSCKYVDIDDLSSHKSKVLNVIINWQETLREYCKFTDDVVSNIMTPDEDDDYSVYEIRYHNLIVYIKNTSTNNFVCLTPYITLCDDIINMRPVKLKVVNKAYNNTICDINKDDDFIDFIKFFLD